MALGDLTFVVTAQVNGATAGLDRVNSSLQTVQNTMGRATSATRHMTNQFDSARTGLQKFSTGVLQQAGYQVGDFAVQVANGTSKMQAFGQQGSQLLGIFGPFGAVLGAVVAIVSAFAVAAQRASGDAKTLGDAASSVGDALSKLESSDPITILDNTGDAAGRLTARYGELLKMINEVAKEERQRAISNVAGFIKSNFEVEVDALQVRKQSLEMTIANSRIAGQSAREQEAALAEVNARIIEIETGNMALLELNGANREEAAKQLAIVRNVLEANHLLTPEVEKQLKQYAEESGLLQEINRQAAQAREIEKDRADRLSAVVRMATAEDRLMSLSVSQNAKSLALTEERRNTHIQITPVLDEEERLMTLMVGLNEDSLRLERERLATVSRMASWHRIMASISTDPEERLMSIGVAANQEGAAAAAQAGREWDAANKPSGASGGSGGSDALKNLIEQLKVNQSLLGVYGARRTVLQELGADAVKYSQAEIDGVIAMQEEYDALKLTMEEIAQRQKDIADTLESAFTDAFMSIVDGTSSAKDAFRSMARDIIAQLYRILVVQRLVGSFDSASNSGTGLVGMIMGAVTGSSFGGFRASGGPVAGGTPYVVGENGPEMFIPGRSGTIVPNGGGGVTVIQNNTFGSGVSRAEIQQMLPKIVETTKAAVFDSQRRSVSGMGY